MNTKSQIFIVDDEYNALQTMRLILEEQFDVTIAIDEYKAVDILRTKDFDVALVDLVMPHISGLEMLRRIKYTKPSTEVIMVTAYGSVSTAKQALKSGAFDYIQKPFDPKQLKKIIHKAIEYRNKRLVDAEEQSKLLERVGVLEREIKTLHANNYQGMMELLSQVIGIRQSYTEQHLKSVEKYAVLVASKLRLSEKEKEDLQVAAVLHDLGKLAVDESILNKTEPLTNSDWTLLKSHPEVGAGIVATVNGWQEAAEGVLYHHEWLDGTGYPKGLKSDKIPIIARIVSVTDAFDAMTSDRAYRKAMNRSKAIGILQQYSGCQFEPEVVNALIDTVT